MQTGRIGSMLLIGRAPPKNKGTWAKKTKKLLVTAWDGSFRVTTGCSSARASPYLQADSGGRRRPLAGGCSLGGTYAVAPADVGHGDGAGRHAPGRRWQRLRVGAVLHPLPELTVGRAPFVYRRRLPATLWDETGRPVAH